MASMSVSSSTHTPEPRLLSPEDLAEYLGVPLATVYRWRARRTGPPGLRVGKHVRYRREVVERWLDEQADPKRAA